MGKRSAIMHNMRVLLGETLSPFFVRQLTRRTRRTKRPSSRRIVITRGGCERKEGGDLMADVVIAMILGTALGLGLSLCFKMAPNLGIPVSAIVGSFFGLLRFAIGHIGEEEIVTGSTRETLDYEVPARPPTSRGYGRISVGYQKLSESVRQIHHRFRRSTQTLLPVHDDRD